MAAGPDQDTPPVPEATIPLPEKTEEPADVNLPINEEVSVETQQEELPEVPEPSSQVEESELKLEVRIATDEDVQIFARNISRVQGRQREIVVAAIEHGMEKGARLLGIQLSSVEAYLGTVCTRVGIPKTNRFHPYDRMDALKRAWEVYKNSPPEALGKTPRDSDPLDLEVDEERLLQIYRDMSPADQEQFLKIGAIFAEKTR